MKNKITVWIYSLIIIIYVLIFSNGCREVSITSPMDVNAFTTLERTIVPVAVPSTSPVIYPYQVSKYTQYGYGVWQYGSGLGYQKRLDITSSSYNGASNSAKLLSFFAITDIHITDKESPAEAPYFGYEGGSISAYSPVMLYTTQVLDAVVKTINSLHKSKHFDFGISLGDNTNSTQYNELRWYIDVLDGKYINPDAGVKDDPIPGPGNDYQDAYQAEGLDKTIKWYQTIGNHDHFWMGVGVPSEYIKSFYTGVDILNMGYVFTEGTNSRGYYLGSIDGRTPYGDVYGAGAVTEFTTPPKILAADPNRRAILRVEWMNEFFNTSSSPSGHGFNHADAAKGFACYTFEPKPNMPIKVIVLDDTQRDDDPEFHLYGHGSLDMERYNWLVKELDKGQSEGKLMIIAAHVPIGFEHPATGSGIFMFWNPYAAVTEANLISKLHTYPNLMLWIAGHRHKNAVTPFPSPDADHPELGFWQVETSSLREFPQQFRVFDIFRNSDNTISIIATDVDPDVAAGSLAAQSRSYSIAASQIFKFPMLDLSYNAELVKQLSPEMQTKIQNLGTTISK